MLSLALIALAALSMRDVLAASPAYIFKADLTFLVQNDLDCTIRFPPFFGALT